MSKCLPVIDRKRASLELKKERGREREKKDGGREGRGETVRCLKIVKQIRSVGCRWMLVLTQT